MRGFVEEKPSTQERHGGDCRPIDRTHLLRFDKRQLALLLGLIVPLLHGWTESWPKEQQKDHETIRY